MQPGAGGETRERGHHGVPWVEFSSCICNWFSSVFCEQLEATRPAQFFGDAAERREHERFVCFVVFAESVCFKSFKRVVRQH